MNIATGAIKGKATDLVEQAKNKLGKNKIQVDWDDLNYPPCLNLFHYKIEELKEDEEVLVIIIVFSFNNYK